MLHFLSLPVLLVFYYDCREKDAIVRTKDEQIKSLKDSQEKQAKTREDMERKYNDHFTQLTGENSKLKSDNEQLEESVKRLNAENHKVSTYAEQMQTNASKLDHNLRKVMEERDGLKQHISQLIEDNERQKHKLNAEIQRVNSENKQLKSRYVYRPVILIFIYSFIKMLITSTVGCYIGNVLNI